MKNEDFISAKTQKVLYLISLIGIAVCALVLIPSVRSAIIGFGETYIVHRKLNAEHWHQRIKFLSVYITSLLISGTLLFCGSRKFFGLPVEKKKVFYIAAEISLIGLFFLLLTILAASNQSIWVDEAFSLASVRHSWKDMIRIQSADVHPPLFFLVLKLCIHIFGESIFLAKFVSIIPAVLTMIFVALFLNKEFSYKTAIIFLLCCIASESVIHYGIEIRMYSWAMFFVTMAAVSAWYIITTGKIRWYAAFLLFAEGAAYTHYYAALVVGIGYLLLLCYVLKYERQKAVKTLILAPLAILLYLPCLPVTIDSFSRASNNFWVPPLNFKTIAGYVLFVFSAGSLRMTYVFCFLFFLILCYFLIRPKTKKELFALGGLSCIIILAGLGILVSILIRPLLVDRYLFPACGLVWLFFAIVCGSLSNKRAIVFVCGVLLVLEFTSVSSSLRWEREENRDFTRFYTYLQEKIQPDDIFIFPPKESSHLPSITAYLFPGHGQVYEVKSTTAGEAFWEMFDRTIIEDLAAVQGRGAWIMMPGNAVQGKPTDFVIPIESNAEFRGDFGWGFYQFKLYYTEYPSMVVDKPNATP